MKSGQKVYTISKNKVLELTVVETPDYYGAIEVKNKDRTYRVHEMYLGTTPQMAWKKHLKHCQTRLKYLHKSRTQLGNQIDVLAKRFRKEVAKIEKLQQSIDRTIDFTNDSIDKIKANL